MAPKPPRAAAQENDAAAERILASYPPEIHNPPDTIDALFSDPEERRAEHRRGLGLLARAGIQNVPRDFDGARLMDTLRVLRQEVEWQAAGPNPPAADLDAFGQVQKATWRLRAALNVLAERMDAPGSRIVDSSFGLEWTKERLDALQQQVTQLHDAVNSQEIEQSLYRNPEGFMPRTGMTARLGLLASGLPHLYRESLRRRFTISRNEGVPPTEGVRFVCAVAAELDGQTITPAAVVQAWKRWRAAARRDKRR